MLNRYFNNSKAALELFALVFGLLVSGNVFANQNGHDFKALNPTPAGIDFLTIHTSRTLDHGRFNLGLFTTYSTNTLPVIETVDGEQTKENIDDTLIHFDTSLAVGLGDFFEIGVTSSAISSAESVSSDYRGEIYEIGLAEIRPTIKTAFVQEKTWGLALILSSSFNQMINNPYLGDGGGPVTTSELALDLRFGKSILAFNAGYRVRDMGDPVLAQTEDQLALEAQTGERNGEVPIAPISDQGVWSVGYLQEFTKKRTHAFSIEAYGARTLQETIDLSDRNQETAEVLLDYRYRPKEDLDFHVGVATETSHAIGSSDWRVLAGLNWKFPGKTKKKKKVVKRKKRKRLPPPKPTQLAHLPKPVKMKPGKPVMPPKFEVLVIHDVLFPFDSSQLILSKAKNGKLMELAKYLKLPPGIKRLEILGHTCSIGSHAYNAGLSLRRATSIKNFLVGTFGLSPGAIQTIGKGETQPTVSNATDSGRKRNRRVEFRIYR